MEKWTEMRSAYMVAKLGTVSAAAQALGVHRATIMRQIDGLESELGINLFQRHAKGYTPTEAGMDLLRVAQSSDDQFSQWANRAKGRADHMSGELVITSLEPIAPSLMPTIAQFQLEHPAISVRYTASDRLFRLDYGEAHIAIRAGPKPQELDNVVSLFFKADIGLFAHKDYVARNGIPVSPDELEGHRYVVLDVQRGGAPFVRWLRDRVGTNDYVFSSTSPTIVNSAIHAGIGIGFVSTIEAQHTKDLVEVIAPKEGWEVPFWIVTHMDLHRTPKIQAFLQMLKAANLGAA